MASNSARVVLRESNTYSVGDPATVFEKNVPRTVRSDANGECADKVDHLLSQRTPEGKNYFELAPDRSRRKKKGRVFGGADMTRIKRKKKKRLRKKNGKVVIRAKSSNGVCAFKKCKNAVLKSSEFCPVHGAVN
jgi:hypothetical protein